jgi:hypothetical protein
MHLMYSVRIGVTLREISITLPVGKALARHRWLYCSVVGLALLDCLLAISGMVVSIKSPMLSFLPRTGALLVWIWAVYLWRQMIRNIPEIMVTTNMERKFMGKKVSAVLGPLVAARDKVLSVIPRVVAFPSITGRPANDMLRGVIRKVTFDSYVWAPIMLVAGVLQVVIGFIAF